MNPFLSDDYVQQLRLMHAGRPWGYGGHKYAEAVKQIAKSVGAKTILDYGCGVGTLKLALQLTQYTVLEYDPGVIGKDKLPEPADLVVATDVLEHIEPDYFHAVMAHLYDLTKKACLVVIATREARSTLPNGGNAHLIVRDEHWWIQILSKRWKIERLRCNELDTIILAMRRRK